MSGIYGKFYYNSNAELIGLSSLSKWTGLYGNAGHTEVRGNGYGGGFFAEGLKEEKGSYENLCDEQNVGFVDAVIYNREDFENEDISDEIFLFKYVLKYGFDALKKINGDFAGAIYDKANRKLFLFRDHMGVRPLFFTKTGDYVAFSTDIRAICGMEDFDAEPDPAYIYKFINGYADLSTENTEIRNVFCVLPGGYIEFDLNNRESTPQKVKYWLVGENRIRRKNYEEYKNELRALIEDAVKRRLAVSADPIGAELSGGLDSGVIDILINRFGRKGIYYSWSYSPDKLDYAPNDERLIIRDICKQESIGCLYKNDNNLLHTEYEAVKRLKAAGVYNDSGFFLESLVLPVYANTIQLLDGCSLLKSKGAKIMFTGHGGDEGVSHRGNAYEIFYNKEYYRYFRYMWSLTHGKKHRIANFFDKCRGNLKNAHEQNSGVLRSVYGVPELINKDFAEKYSETQIQKFTFFYDPITYIRNGGSRNRLDNIALYGGMTGIHYMVPYLDHRVVDYAVSIPRYLYRGEWKDRRIFRDAFKDIMPNSLYKLEGKEDTSRSMIKPKEDWYPDFKKRKEDIYNKFDKDYWKEYVDISEVEKWYEKGRPTEEERENEDHKTVCLSILNLLKNMIDRSKIQP